MFAVHQTAPAKREPATATPASVLRSLGSEATGARIRAGTRQTPGETGEQPERRLDRPVDREGERERPGERREAPCERRRDRDAERVRAAHRADEDPARQEEDTRGSRREPEREPQPFVGQEPPEAEERRSREHEREEERGRADPAGPGAVDLNPLAHDSHARASSARAPACRQTPPRRWTSSMNRLYNRSQPGRSAESYCSECQSTAKPPPFSAAQSSKRTQTLLRFPGAQAEVALGRERDVHRRERHLDEVARRIPLEVPGAKRMRDAGAKAESVAEAERRVVREAGRLELGEIAVRVERAGSGTAGRGRGRRAPRGVSFSAHDPRWVVGGRVAAVEADLGAAVAQRLDEPRAQPFVRLDGGAVELVRVLGQEEERRRGAAAPLVGEDPIEAPERIGPASTLCSGAPGQPAQLPQRRTGRDRGPRSVFARAAAPLRPYPRPLPGRVDVVSERNREARPAPARGLQAELSTQPLEWRVERVEAGGRRPEAVVLVARAVSLLDAGEVEERLGQRVVAGARRARPAPRPPRRTRTSSPKPTSRAPIESSTQRALRSTASGIT